MRPDDNTVYLPAVIEQPGKVILRPSKRPRAPVPMGTFRADLVRASEMSAEADAPNTRRAYESDLGDWKDYADANDLKDFPIVPEALAGYLSSMEKRGLKYTTIRRRCSALSRLHKDLEAPSPFDNAKIRNQLKALGRRLGREKKGKKAVTAAMVVHILDRKTSTPMERALMAVGFTSGMRRSELVALRWRDVEEFPTGLVIHVRRGKTDQQGEGRVKGLPFAKKKKARCAARLLLEWKRVAKVKLTDKVFPIPAKDVAALVKSAAEAVGEDPREFGAHSLRAGLVTTATEAGVMLAVTMEATGHKDANTAAGYSRSANALKNAAHIAAVTALEKAS